MTSLHTCLDIATRWTRSIFFSSSSNERLVAKERLRALEAELRLATTYLKHVDNPALYPHEVRLYEWKLERLREQKDTAASRFKRQLIETTIRIGEEYLHQARSHLARLQQDPQRFMAERRRELAAWIAELTSQIAQLRPPPPEAPESIPSSPTSPSPTLHHRRPHARRDGNESMPGGQG